MFIPDEVSADSEERSVDVPVTVVSGVDVTGADSLREDCTGSDVWMDSLEGTEMEPAADCTLCELDM